SGSRTGATSCATFVKHWTRSWFHPPREVAPYNSATTMTTDRELMHRVAQGDERAFADLANRYSARLLTVAWRLLGNRADAEDAVQRALLRLFQSAASY